MTDSLDPTAAARAVAVECANDYQAVLADRLVAAYALGSLAHGGYAPAVSDIDLALVLTDTRDSDAATIETTRQSLHPRSPAHRKLSVFWSSQTALRDGRDDGRFPAIDRLDLHDHGQLLLGTDVARHVAIPTAGELLLDGAQFAVKVLATDEVIAEFHQPRRLLEDPVWFTKAVLFPVRFLYTAARTIGRAATNDEAIDWYLTQPQAVATPLVRLAARVRQGHRLTSEEATPLLADGLVPLYLRYVDDQTPRLHQAEAPTDLVTAFTQWRQLLNVSRQSH
ncbi:MAG TPA: hypothetical protein VGM75_11740 [Pseudonocardiaceae bacterium]